jgi:hypothetical protein
MDIDVSLDELVHFTADHVTQLQRLERTAKAPASSQPQPQQRQQQQTHSTYRGAASSTTRRAHSSSGANNTNTNTNTDAADMAAMGIERKIEFLYRRTKLIDDKLKAAEKERLEYKAMAEDQATLLESLLEERKTEHKQMLMLREHVASLKSQVHALEKKATAAAEHGPDKHAEQHARQQLSERDAHVKELEKLLATQSRLLEEADARRRKESARGHHEGSGAAPPKRLSESEAAALVETVKKAVKKDFNALLNDVVKSCAVEQARFLSKWAERTTGEGAGGVGALRSEAETTILPAVEKEVARMVTEFAKLKGRQESLEDRYRELHSGVAVREKRAEEAHRRAVAAYKKEVQAVVDAVGRRVNAFLQDHSRSSKTVLELSVELDEVAQRSDRQRAELVRRVQDVQTLQQEQQQLIESLGWLSDQPWAHHDAGERDADGVLVASKGMGPDTPLSVVLSNKFRELSGAIDTCSRNHDFLAQSVGALVKQLRTELGDVGKALHEHKEGTAGSVESLQDFNKKIKSKVNELSVSVASIAKIREAVEALLMDVDLKASNDTEDSPHAKATSSALMKLGMRIQALEERLDSGTSAMLSHSALAAASTPQLGLGLGLGVGGAGAPVAREDGGSSSAVSQAHVLHVYRKLQEEVQQEFARLQSEVEEALHVGWKEMGARSVEASQASVKTVEGAVQRVQGVIMTMHKDQRLLSERVLALEHGSSGPLPASGFTAGGSSSGFFQTTGGAATESMGWSAGPSLGGMQFTPVHNAAPVPISFRSTTAAAGPATALAELTTARGGAHGASVAAPAAAAAASDPAAASSAPSSSAVAVSRAATATAYEPVKAAAATAAALPPVTATSNVVSHGSTESTFAAELKEAVQRLHMKKNEHRFRYLNAVVNSNLN